MSKENIRGSLYHLISGADIHSLSVHIIHVIHTFLMTNTLNLLLDFCDKLYIVLKNQVQIFKTNLPHNSLQVYQHYQSENCTNHSGLRLLLLTSFFQSFVAIQRCLPKNWIP